MSFRAQRRISEFLTNPKRQAEMFRAAQHDSGPFMSQSFPDLNINNFLCFQRLTRGNAQQAICLTQTKQRVRFLTTGWRELSVFKFPADVMRSIAVVR